MIDLMNEVRCLLPHLLALSRDMLVDTAPYLFRGRVPRCLTRLSATGLANVTPGGGQVPAFVIAAARS